MMAKNQQKRGSDPLRTTREKLIRKIKLALKNSTAQETLRVWILMKQQELKRTTPDLSEQQIESVIKSLILELGYDIITPSTTPPTEPEELEVEREDEVDEDTDTESSNDDIEDNKDDFLEELSEVSEDKISSHKQRVPALRKIEKLRASTRNGRHS